PPNGINQEFSDDERPSLPQGDQLGPFDFCHRRLRGAANVIQFDLGDVCVLPPFSVDQQPKKKPKENQPPHPPQHTPPPPATPHLNLLQEPVGGATIAPNSLQELKIPAPGARSFFENHSATALMLAGKTAASPRPRAMREIAKLRSELARAVPIEAMLQKTI